MNEATLELVHGELIAPARLAGRIIEPNEIPVHPKVYEALVVYTPGFVEQVVWSLPDSIREDVSTIERIMGINLRLEVTDKAIISDGEELPFGDFDVRVNPHARFVEVAYVSSNIALDTREGYKARFRPSPTHPMNVNKLRRYGFIPDDPEVQLPTWYIHDLSHAGFGGFLCYRNFAIAFNNLGLREVGLDSRQSRPH